MLYLKTPRVKVGDNKENFKVMNKWPNYYKNLTANGRTPKSHWRQNK